MSAISLLGPCNHWGRSVFRATHAPDDGPAEAVWVQIALDTASTEALAQAQRAAAPVMALHHPGILPLQMVISLDGRVAWVYPRVEGVGLHRILEEEGSLSARAAAEVVVRVAALALELQGPAIIGFVPRLEELILDVKGHLWVAGLVGPAESPPPVPNHGNHEADLVFRLGALLVNLLTGSRFALAPDRETHTVALRRALLRAMDRPGPVLTERYADWLRGMLAWTPAERPSLYAMVEGLQRAGDATGGEDLADWADVWVAELLGEPGKTVHFHQVVPDEDSADTANDESTKEAVVLDDPGGSGSRPAIVLANREVLPVFIGPPPEAMSHRVSLPADILEPGWPRPRRKHVRIGSQVWWIAILTGAAVGVILVTAAALLAWRLWPTQARQEPVIAVMPSRTPIQSAPEPSAILPDEPSITPNRPAPILPKIDPNEVVISPWGDLDSQRFDVIFTTNGERNLDVRCGDIRGEGRGRVSMVGLSEGRCTIASGQTITQVEVDGPLTFFCFPDGNPLCVQQEAIHTP